MALIFKSRVRETSATTGTGAIALAGAVSDHRAFASVMSVGDTAWVTIVNPGTGEWEISLCTYSGVNTLTRTTVYESSAADLAVNFGAGTKDVFLDQPAVRLGATESLQDQAVTTAKLADANVTNGKLANNAVSADKTDATVWSTGDCKLTLKTAADSGWLMMDDGTFGDASSGATHIGSQYQALFNLLFANIADADAPILTSGGGATTRAGQGTAAAAWAAHCRMTLPKMLGRAMAVAGAGSGLTSRALGHAVGEETHTLTLAEAPTGQLTLNFSDNGHSHDLGGAANTAGASAVSFASTSGGSTISGSSGVAVKSASTGIAASLSDHAGGGAHNNMQPSAFWNVEIKL